MAQQYTLGKTSTTVATNEGITRITYHRTVVVAFDGNKITLDSGGWYTNTTKTRMNQASNQFELGFSVYQKDHIWFVKRPDGETVQFVDGMSFAA